MGYDVFTCITAPVHCSSDEEINNLKAIAQKHLSNLEETENRQYCVNKVINLFLSSIINEKCIFGASKGDGLCWASVGNYVNIDIVDDLKPFFLDLWQTNILPRYYGAIVIVNPEDPHPDYRSSTVAEIRLTPEGDGKKRYGKPLEISDIQVKLFEQDWHTGFPR